MSKFEMFVSVFELVVLSSVVAFLVSPYFDGAPGDQILAAAVAAVDAMK